MFYLPAAAGLTIYRGEAGGLLSPEIWSRVHRGSLTADGHSPTFMVGDDFLTFGIGTAVTGNVGYYVSQAGAYKSYEDTGGTIAQIATAVGGVITLTTDADTDQENWIAPGTATTVLGKITTGESSKVLAFECRFKTSAVVGNIFVGLTEEGLAAADTITDAGAMADKDFIGFKVLEGAPTTLKFVYKKAGQTEQVVFSYGTAIAADTWYNVGFIHDPNADPSKRITAFVDNVEQTTYITDTMIAAATFPSGEELNVTMGHKNDTDITALSLDGWAFAGTR